MAGEIEALSEEHMILAEAPLGPMEEIVDFLNEGGEEGAKLRWAVWQEGRERGFRIDTGLDGGFPHQILTGDPFIDAALDLLIDPFGQREEAGGIVAEDKLLLLLKKVEQSTVFVKFLPKRFDDLWVRRVHDGLVGAGPEVRWLESCE